MKGARSDPDKLIEAAVEVLRHAPERRLGMVVLNKTLFYLDLRWLLEFGETLTGVPYVALKNGPVVAKYKDRLIKELEVRGLAKQQVVGNWRPMKLAASAAETDDKPYTALAKQVLAEIAPRLAEGASDYSHENPGWIVAWESGGKRKGGAIKSIDMFVAMQQLADDDEWLNVDFTASERKAIEDAIASRRSVRF